MWPIAPTLYLLLSLWASSLCHTLLIMGPCEVNREKATFNCSRKNLISVPPNIWPNVTELDLSENHLNLTHAKSLQNLWNFYSMIKLNLSGNYLPLLVKQHFSYLPSLEILDLSGCRLAALEPDVLHNFPRLQKLFLRPRDYEQRHSSDDFIMVNQNAFQRKLLTETASNNTSNNITDSDGTKPLDGWKYLVAVLVIAIILSVLIAVGAKCKLFHHYLASYRHSRLSEADGASQCDPAAFEVGFSGHGTSGSGPHLEAGARDMMEEDDDGFIEDNYIQASERERAEREAEHWQHEQDEVEEEDEEMEEFSIG